MFRNKNHLPKYALYIDQMIFSLIFTFLVNALLSQQERKNNIFLMMLIMDTTTTTQPSRKGKPRSFILCKPVIAVHKVYIALLFMVLRDTLHYVVNHKCLRCIIL
jgi:hypothetical protein